VLWTVDSALALLALSVPQEQNPGSGRGFLHSGVRRIHLLPSCSGHAWIFS